MIKKLISLVSVLAIVTTLSGVQTATLAADNRESEHDAAFLSELTQDVSGVDGEISWSLTTEGLLTISGKGGTYDSHTAPWKAYKDSIKTAVINNVAQIPGAAFEGYQNITSVTLPDGVTSIGIGAFYECRNLTGITIPKSVTSIGSHAFNDCSSLTSIEIPDGVVSIERNTFEYCSGLTSVTIPKSVTSIGERAFYNCLKLQDITLPDNLLSIGDSAFGVCDSLKSITIPGSVTAIGKEAFYGCSALNEAHYLGTYEQWNQISIAESNDALINAVKKTPLNITYKVLEDNGTWGIYSTDTVKLGERVDLSMEITKDGWNFIGWNTDKNAAVGLESYIASTDTTLYAILKEKSYLHVTYDYRTNGGISSTKTEARLEHGDTIDLSPTAEKPGWVFVGWNTDKNATVGCTAFIPDTDTTLYAIFKELKAPHIIAVDTYAHEAILRFEQVPALQTTVQVSMDNGVNWYDAKSNLESDGVIKVTGLSPETMYLFRIKCEYAQGTLYSENVLGKTTAYVSSECDIENVNFPIGAIIDQQSLSITSARVMNSFDEITLRLRVSEGATWNVYASRTAAERNINPIPNNTIALTAGVSKMVYIRVTAGDGQTYKIYSMQIYRQSKSASPVFSVSGGSIEKGTQLKLSANGEIIKYTTDGTDPSETNGIIYTSPIEINSDMTIKAVAKEAAVDEYSDVITNVYYLSDGNIIPEIMNSDAIPGGGYYMNFNILNNSARLVDGTAIIAIYDQFGSMIGIQSQEFSLEANNILENNIEMTFSALKNARYYKLFIWDDFSAMQPIMSNPYIGDFVK